MFNQNDTEKKLDWMYKGANSLVDREDYLLGRSVDKSLEQLNAEEKQKQLGTTAPPKNHVEHECIPPSIRDYKLQQQLAEQVDLQAKLQEDPLLTIKKREEETRRQFLQNPVQLKKLQKALSKQESKSKKRKNLDEILLQKLKLLQKGSDDVDADYTEKKGEEDNDLDIILMHKFNALKSKLTEEDLKDIMDGKFTDSDSSEEDSDDEEGEKEFKKKGKKHKKKKAKKSKHFESDESSSSEDEKTKRKSKKKRKQIETDIDSESEDEKKKKKKNRKKKYEKKHQKKSRKQTDSESESSSESEDVKKIKKRKRKGKKKHQKESSSSSISSEEDENRERQKYRRSRSAQKNRNDKRRNWNDFNSKKHNSTHHQDRKRSSSEECRKKDNQAAKSRHSRSPQKNKSPKLKKSNDEEIRTSTRHQDMKRSEEDRRQESQTNRRSRSPQKNRSNRRRKSIDSAEEIHNSTRHHGAKRSEGDERQGYQRNRRSRSLQKNRSAKSRKSNDSDEENHNSSHREYRKRTRSKHRSKSPKTVKHIDKYTFREDQGSNGHNKRRSTSPTDSKSKDIKRKIGPERPPQDYTRRPENSDDSDHNRGQPQIQNWGLVKSDGTKIELLRRSRSTSKERERRRQAKAQSSKQEEQKAGAKSEHRAKRLTSAEKEEVLREMRRNADEQDVERAKNIKRYRDEDAREARQRDFDADFARKEYMKSTNSSTVESRIKANLNNIQRGKSDMNSHFSRRH